MDGLILLFFLVALILFWLDSRRAHEFALGICKHLCEQEDVMLLDQTIALNKLWLAKQNGKTVFARTYRFDYSSYVDERHSGELLMHGTQPIAVSMNGQTVHFN